MRVFDLTRPDDAEVTAVGWAEGGRSLISLGASDRVRRWELEPSLDADDVAGRELRSFDDNQVFATTVSGSKVAAGGEDGTVRVWDLTRGSPPVVLELSDEPIFSVGFFAGQLVAAGLDGLWVIDLASTTPAVTELAGEDFVDVEVRDGFALAGSRRHVVELWQLSPQPRLVRQWATSGQVMSVSFVGRSKIAALIRPEFLGGTPNGSCSGSATATGLRLRLRPAT